MKKIMFNDRYGLTEAVVEGRKTMTRRVISAQIHGRAFAYRHEYYADTLDAISEEDALLEFSPFKPGEVVAVAQSYESIHDEMMARDYGADIYDAFRNAMVADKPGWKNKMFVRADLMPHHIRITNIRVERLQDISEDERIERECGEAKPGLGKFLAAAKDYAFVKSQQNREWGEIPDHVRLINAIAGYIRFPRALVPADVEKFADELLAVKEILTPYPDSTESARLAAEKIRKEIQKYLDEQQQEQQQQGENGGEAGGEGQGSGDAAGEGEKLAQAIKEMAEALEKMSESVSEASDCSDVSQDLDEKQLQLAMGYAERGEYSDKTVILPSDEDRGEYERAYDNVRQYIPAVAKSLQQESTELKFVVAGMKNGRLDTNRLAEAYQNVENVYKLQGEVKSTRLSVAILIDESGSMGSWSRESKCVKAREAAVLLNEALSRLPNVDLYIYGHTDDWDSKYGDAVELRVYREGKNAKRYALGSTRARRGNLDSIAIREVAARVRKRTQERCLFFVITDGAPNEGTEEVKKAVKDVTRKGFDVLAISIESHYSPSEMYDHYITLSDLSKLPIDLGKLVKGMIRKNTKRMIKY